MATGNLYRFKNKLDDMLKDESNPCKGIFEWIERRTGVSRFNVAIGISIIVGIYLAFGCGAQILCNMIGVVYPAYISIHAIESSTKADDTKWLIYWVTFAVLSIFEHFSFILTNIFPFYWLIKCIFLIWCMLPIENNGSAIIYHHIVRPNFLKHHKTVDKIIDDTVNRTKDSVSNLLKTE